MKKIILICILMVGLWYSFAENLSKYSFQFIGKIKTGNKEGEIGWQVAVAGRPSGPKTMVIMNDKIYIADIINKRINVYNINIQYIKTIIEKGNNIQVHASSKYLVDNNENIISFYPVNGLKKIDNNGSTLFFISKENMPNYNKNRKNFFLINDELLLYNDNNQIIYITKEGNIVSGKGVMIKINQLTKDMEANKSEMNANIIPVDKINIINKVKNDKSMLIIKDQFYSTEFYKTQIYFEKIKDVREYITTQKAKSGVAITNKVELNIEDFSMHFIGYDKNHNSYWQGIIDKPSRIDKYAVIIYSKYGELLDAFYYGQYDNYEPNFILYPTTGALIAVAPNGDVYFLIGNKEEYTFYKVENNW